MSDFKISRFNINIKTIDILNCIIGPKKLKNFEIKIKNVFRTKNLILVFQARVGLYILLKYLLKKNPKKKIVLISPYTLTEIINCIKIAGCDIEYLDIDLETGLPKISDLQLKLSKKSLCIIFTHLFTKKKAYKDLLFFCKKRKLEVINDNAINLYFYKKKIFGMDQKFSIYSFNYQKNISSILGGLIHVKNKISFEEIKNFSKKFDKKLSLFSIIKKLIFLKFINILFCNKHVYNLFTFNFLKPLMFKNDFVTKLIYPNYKKKISSKKTENYEYSFTDRFSNFGLKSLENFKHDQTHRQKISREYLKIFNNYSFINNISKNSLSINLEYPVIIKFNLKKKFYNFLLNNEYEVRAFWYTNNASNRKFKNSHYIEKNVVCFPTHNRITQKYVKNLDKLLKKFQAIYCN